tara:strand:+ start:481 stop:642 length:162 start_codon:yes stop_codon:yes gene_type:complete
MEYIKIGNIEFRKESLKGITLKDAENNFKSIDKRLVKMAWQNVNPKKNSRKKS